MKQTRIAINGFGRIGRLFFRQAFSAEGGLSSQTPAKGDIPAPPDGRQLEVVAINDLGDLENLAYLLKYDTVYGQFPKEIRGLTRTERGLTQNYLVVDNREIAVFQIKDPSQLPWKDLNIDIVVEATGFFESYEKAKAHIAAGAKRVVITAPAKDLDDAGGPEGSRQGGTYGAGKTVLMGVNEDELKKCVITSNGSCTTNAASPVIQIMSENPGIEKAVLNTVHGYTATQNLVDGPAPHLSSEKGEGGGDFRRGRAAAQNIVLSTTGAAIAVTRAIKELDGKFDGIAIRVPIVSGSIADITFISKRNVTVEEINDIFRKAAESERWQGILKVTDDQIVSSDILGEPYGAIVDLNFTKVVDGNLVKVLSWYDNEAGYVSTLVKHIQAVAQFV